MALTRMSLKTASVLRAPPSYGQVATDALSSRFTQLYHLIFLLAALVSTLLAFFLNTTWLRSVLSIALRAVPITVSIGIIPILRKSQTHVQYLLHLSAIAEYIDRFRSRLFVTTLVTYLASSYIFIWTYQFQVSNIGIKSANLTTFGAPLLNERWIYYYLVIPVTLGFIAAATHVARDVDRLGFDLNETNTKPRDQIKTRTRVIFWYSLIISTAAVIGIPIFYLLFLRPFAWTTSLSIAQNFIRLHHSRAYSGSPISPGMLFHTFLITFVLSFGWMFANMIYSVYLSMPPIHRGELLSSKSQDRNGTLIDGLHRRNRQLNSMLAFWELFRISCFYPERRQEIFTDIDPRPTAWERVRVECVQLLTDISDRMKPKSPLPKPAQQLAGKEGNPSLQGVDSIAGVIPIKTSNVFAVNKAVPTSNSHHLIQSIQDNDARSSQKVVSAFESYSAQAREFVRTTPKVLEFITRSRYGVAFRITLARKVRQIIPNPSQTCAGIYALAYLVVHSRAEDKYGVVQMSIAGILDQLVEVNALLNKYISKPPKHWSDDKSSTHDKESLGDMLLVRDAIDEAFETIVAAFIANTQDLNLTPRVLERIRELTSEPILNDSLVADANYY